MYLLLWVCIIALSIHTPTIAQSNETTTDPPDNYIYGQGVELNHLVPDSEIEEPISLLLQGTLKKTQEFPITLETVLALVDDQNLYIAQSRMNRKMQKNRFYRSMANFLPDFEGSYTHSRFQGGIQVFGNEVITIYQTRITPQMTASTTVHPGGRRILEALAAKRRSASGKQLLKGTRQEQLSRAAEEFYQLLEARIQVENLSTTVQEARAQVALNDARREAGVGTKLDLMQSKTYQAQQERALIDAENTFAQAEQALLDRLNLDTTVHLLPEDENTNTPITLVSESITSDDLVHWATDNHPDIRSVALEAKALKSDFIARATDVIPAVDLQVYESFPGSSYENLTLTRFAGLVVRTQIGENLGLGWPLDLRHAFLAFKQKQFERDAMTRTVERQVTSAFLNSQAYLKAIDSAHTELESAQESSRLAEGRYKVGLGIYLDVLTANSSLSNARTKLAAAILGYNRAQVQLLEAVGATSPETILTGFNLKQQKR